MLHFLQQLSIFSIMWWPNLCTVLQVRSDQGLVETQENWFTFVLDWTRVRTILALGYWVLGNIQGYWEVLVLGGYFLLLWHPIQYQSDSSQHRPNASEWLSSSTCDLYSDRCNHVSGHHADCNCLLNTIIVIINDFWDFFVVIAKLYTSIGIGIGYWYR